MKISVVIPIYNEERAIEGNIRELVAALEALRRSWELILVNDGSTDRTLSRIEAAARGNPKIRVISYAANRGRGFALRTGFARASGDYVIATESDLTWGTGIIQRFVDELDQTDADIVVASPHMAGGRLENVPLFRRLLSQWGNKVFSLALPGHLTMATGMTRGYRREVLDSLDLESDDKELHVEILAKALDVGFRIKEIPAVLRWKQAAPGAPVRKSHFKMRRILSHLALSFFVRPFLLFGTTGAVLIGTGAAIGAYLLVLSISGTPVAGRPLLIVAVLLIITGFQILIFGFLASQNRAMRRQLSRMQRILLKRHGTENEVPK